MSLQLYFLPWLHISDSPIYFYTGNEHLENVSLYTRTAEVNTITGWRCGILDFLKNHFISLASTSWQFWPACQETWTLDLVGQHLHLHSTVTFPAKLAFLELPALHSLKNCWRLLSIDRIQCPVFREIPACSMMASNAKHNPRFASFPSNPHGYFFSWIEGFGANLSLPPGETVTRVWGRVKMSFHSTVVQIWIPSP